MAQLTYDEFNAFCRQLPATTHQVQWGGAHVWKVGGKVFAIGGWEKSGHPAFTFKTSAHHFEMLKDLSGFRPAPYMASRGMLWIQQFDTPRHAIDELKYYLTESHRIVSLGLPKYRQKALGLNQA